MERRPRCLLDTHTFLWWMLLDGDLSRKAASVLETPSNEVLLSAGSCWEIAIKYKLGRLSIPAALAGAVGTAAKAAGLSLLEISFAHAQRAGALPMLHKDPFDQLLIAQAIEEGCVLLSRDKLFDAYAVERVWD